MNPQPLGKSIGLIGGLGVGAAVHYYRELPKMDAARLHLDAIVHRALDER